MPVTPLINGVNYAWANITCVIFDVPVIGITEIDYDREQVKEENYGHGIDPISRGYGNIKNKASITLYQDEWKRIIASSPNRDPLQIPPFDITVVYGGSRVSADRDILRSVEFKNDPFSAKQGDTKLMVKLELAVGSIER